MANHFAVESIPSNSTIFSYLKQSTDYERACRAVRTRLRQTEKLELDLLGVDVAELRESVNSIIASHGFGGWRHQGGESSTYGGFSLTYNPDHQDSPDPHVGSIGTPKNLRSEFFWNATGRHAELKHSYFDTYGFRKRTPASRQGALGRFIDSFGKRMIRSRVGIIPGDKIDTSDPAYQHGEGWHRDEPVFENLRINIPLQTDANYVFQMEGGEPYHLEVGTAYSWDTNRPHRVFARGPTKVMRIHLVLGFAPWFDYSDEADEWFPNEFFGRMHPFDMLADGYFSKHLRLRPNRLRL